MKYLIYSTTLFITIVHATAFAAEQPRSATQLLQRALYLADLYNWVDAAPEFAKAERLFLAAGDKKNALYARLGRTRATLADGPLAQVSTQLASDLQRNIYLRTDKRLRMFCLIVKGDLDGSSDPIEMGRDWHQVYALAREQRDQKWEYRSLAEIGVAAFFAGHIEEARKDVGTALLAAGKIGGPNPPVRILG